MKKIILLALAVGIMTQSMCSAANISISKKGGSTVVEGNVDLGVLPHADDLTIIGYDSNGNVNYIDVVPVSKDGKATFKYSNLGASGDYTYKFTVPSLNIKETATLMGFIGNDYWNVFTENVNGYIKANDLVSLRTCIEAEKDNLAIDVTDYSNLKDCDAVYQIMKNDFDKEYKNAEAVLNCFYKAVALCKWKEGGAIADYYNNAYVALNEHMPASGNSENISVLDDLSANAQNAVFEAISKKLTSMESNGDATKAFVADTIFTGIANAESYMDVNKLLNAYADVKLLNVEKDMPVSVYKALTKKSYSSYSAIEDAVKDAKKGGTSGGQSGGTSSGGNSGGNSSGSGSGTSNAGVVVSPPSNAKPIETISGNQSGKMTFADMDDAKWALDAVEALYKKGIISGNGDGTFLPHNSVKREEMTKMLVDMTGYAKDTSVALPFYDVNADLWSYPYICAAYANSIISGITDYEFGMGAEITREQAVTLLYRVLKNKGVEMSGTSFRFDDDYLISDWAKEGIYGLYSIGVIGGKTANTFVPKENMTRVEVAVMLNGALKYFDGGDA